MQFFKNAFRVVGDVIEEAGSAVGDVVEDFGDVLLGERGGRGERIGRAVGTYVGAGNPVAGEFGARLGRAISDDLGEAGDVALERIRQETTSDLVLEENPLPPSREDLFNTDEVITAGFPGGGSRTEDFDTGTVIDIRYPRDIRQEAIGVGMDILGKVGDFFFGDDDNQPATARGGMMMCPPAAPKAFNVNKQTGCVTITRKQQAKLREAVRMFGGPQVASNLGISNQLLQQLLLKTFRARRRGISGADIRAVKRVDRQMHSLAMALGGISSTSKAVVGRRSPTKR